MADGRANVPERAATLPQLLSGWSTPHEHVVQAMGHYPAKIFAELVETVAAGLRGVTTLDRPVIAYEPPQGVDGALLFLAAASAGIAAPVRPGLTAEEQNRTLGVIDPDLYLRADDIDIEALASEGRASNVDQTAPEPDDLALLLTTSGTTGSPKRVGLDHRRLTESAANIADWFELSSGDHALTIMPLFHIHGLVAGVLAPLAGRGSATPVSFDAFAFGRHAAEVQPTWCSAVPSMWELVLRRWRDRADELRSAPWRFLRTSSSALSPELMRELEATFEVPVLEAYGMTEAAHQISANPLPPRVAVPGSVGHPTGGIELRIATPDETGEGSIQIRGATVIDSYLGGESAESFVDGWFETGDEGYLDADGRLFITGRTSEFINRGGEKVSPLDVERALSSHASVDRAVAFPVRHEVLGQVPGALAVLRTGSTTTVDELRTHIAERLSRPKRPTRIEVVADWPTGPTGKVQRRFLAEQIGWE